MTRSPDFSQPYFRPFLCTFIFVLFFNFNFVQGFLWGPRAKIKSEPQVSVYTQKKGKWDRTWGQGCVCVAGSTICRGVCDFCLQALTHSKRLQTSQWCYLSEWSMWVSEHNHYTITFALSSKLSSKHQMSFWVQQSKHNCYLILFWSAL